MGALCILGPSPKHDTEMTFVVKMDKGGCPTMIQRGECEKQSKRCKKKKGIWHIHYPASPAR